MSNGIELYLILKLRMSFLRICPCLKIHVWRLFGGFVMQGHIYLVSILFKKKDN